MLYPLPYNELCVSVKGVNERGGGVEGFTVFVVAVRVRNHTSK